MMIDFHTHILPGIDDGSPDTALSLKMLHTEAGEGTQAVVFTPHFYADKSDIGEFLEMRQASFQRLSKEAVQGLPKMLVGSETYYYQGIADQSEVKKLCIEGTNLLLLEMPFRQWTNQEYRTLLDLLAGGITPMLAHVDRYISLQKNKEVFWNILSLPVKVQINASALANIFRRRFIVEMFKDGFADVLGSDCHNMTDRAPGMLSARELLEKKLGSSFLRQVDENAAALLAFDSYTKGDF